MKGYRCENYKKCMLITDHNILVKLILLLDLHVLSRTASAVCYSCNAKCVKTRFILE